MAKQTKMVPRLVTVEARIRVTVSVAAKSLKQAKQLANNQVTDELVTRLNQSWKQWHVFVLD